MARWGGAVLAVVRRLPFTSGLVILSLVVAVATTTLWSPAVDKPWFHDVAYGLPSLEAGRWWTPVTGSFLAFLPIQYLPIVLTSAIFVGIGEWVLGTRTAAWVAITGQIGAVVVVSLVVALLRHTDWAWADARAGAYDVGFSAGAFAVLAVASAKMRPPWRGRVRVLMWAYEIPNLILIGTLADLAHLFSLLFWLPLGPRIVGRPARLWLPGLSRYELRWLAAGLFWLGAVVTLAGQFLSVEGPFGHFGGTDLSWWSVVPTVVLDVVIGVGLLHGRRLWWRGALLISAVAAVLATIPVLTLAMRHETPPGLGLYVVILVFDLIQVAVLVLGRRAFRNPSRRRRAREGASVFGGTPSEGDRDEVRMRLATLGSPNDLAWMTTWPENRWWFPADRDGYVAYQIRSGVALGLCDPVAEPEERADLLDLFVRVAREGGTTPCFFSVTEEVAVWARGRGWSSLQVAEEAVIDLPTMEFRGKKWQDVRTALNQARKQEITHRLVRLAEAPRGIQVQVRAISDAWVGDKGLPEMGFTLGGVDEAMDPQVLVGLAVDAEGTVQGVTSWMPVHAEDGAQIGWTLDLMRRLPDGFRYTMEFLIASACLTFKEQGYALVSLSGAPLAHLGEEDETFDRSGIDRVLELVGETLEPYYGFQSLEAFKAKFQPRYKRLYMVFPDEAALPKIGVALGSAYLDGLGPAKLLSLART